MAARPRAWKAEYAKSGRASCKSCRSPIAKDQLRLGKMVQATQFDGFMPMWNHASCIFSKKNQIKSVDDVEGIDALRWDDQERIRNYVGSASAATSSTDAVPDKCTIELAPSARSSCRQCSEKITKGALQLCVLYFVFPQSIVMYRFVFQLSLRVKVPKGTKRKNGEDDMYGYKAPKIDRSMSEGTARNKGKIVEPDSNASSADLQHKLKEQSDTLWKLKDELKKHVSTAELRNILEANEQDSSGPERHLLDRCADGMLFGALAPCPVCSGSLYYYNGQYQCSGNVSEWSKCSYSTMEPVRMKKKWQIPDGTENDFLTKWFKLQKVKKPVRVLPPMSPDKSGSKATQRARLLSSDGLDKLRFSIVGQSEKNIDECIQKLKLSGADFHARVTKDINCLVSCGELDNGNGEVRKARRLKIPIVREDYIEECVKKNRMLPFDLYKVESIFESSKGGTVTIKVKGRSAVHESSGLQDTAHILEDGKSIYNTTLNMSDLARGFEALTEIQNLLKDTGDQELAVRESYIVAASNRFFTLIPSIHPHIIQDEEDLMMKAKMLEALQDIEIASKLVGFDSDNDESLDDKYKKLHCNITPLAHDSEDYKLIERYLLNTHAPTHKFGKGLYFADLVSKSAQYCYVDRKNPVGLMLLSEVALGDMHELKKATTMDKPPSGKHSTKGLGKTVPLESEFVKWRDDVVVPCGKPVPSSVRASELLYNEYIVYNTSQVKMQFLLKVRFHHKRCSSSSGRLLPSSTWNRNACRGSRVRRTTASRSGSGSGNTGKKKKVVAFFFRTTAKIAGTEEAVPTGDCRHEGEVPTGAAGGGDDGQRRGATFLHSHIRRSFFARHDTPRSRP
ncbi:hypothetical protein PR202_ga30309 [Eleusine coracana subsp. coracana]|uniref:Poly [ADP-ribose] polymerase n=1 Tax=Eleusine coracana subsp. coracana TaxID=191504 RepID=A0AAV5DNN9_ELECO|nr:hypothetical protein PR202_ga30309 [Eleusine coracana subsp. coracana]